MKKFLLTLVLIAGIVIVGLAASHKELAAQVAPEGDWQQLYVPGGGYWRRRIGIEVINHSELDISGDPLGLRIGNREGELNLIAAEARSIRVSNEEGIEYLFNILTTDGRPIREGEIPAGAYLIFPAEVSALSQIRYYIYYDNPLAWAVPEFLGEGGGWGGGPDTVPPLEMLAHAWRWEDPESPLEMLVHASEKINLKVVGENASWLEREGVSWKYRLPVQIKNFTKEPLRDVFASVNLMRLKVRRRGEFDESLIMVADGEGRVVPNLLVGNELLFVGSASPLSITYYYVYLSPEKIKGRPALGYEQLMRSRVNLVRNADFEEGAVLPEEWRSELEIGYDEAGRPVFTLDLGAEFERFSPGKFGEYCLRMQVAPEAPGGWRGWRQSIPVKPNTTYFYSGWVRTEDIAGAVTMHLHFHDESGELTGARHLSTGVSLSGTHEWTLLSTMLRTSPDTASVELHLTMDTRGTVWHDGILFTEVAKATFKSLETPAPASGELMTWEVNPIVKVFPDDPPQDLPGELHIHGARNEKEPVQLVLRSSYSLEDLTVKVSPPANKQGEKLSGIEIEKVGFVPLDHLSGYFGGEGPPFRRFFPTAGGDSDGWVGYWPDPLIPVASFDLKANVTQPIWITVDIPPGTRPGDYAGEVIIKAGEETLKTIPLRVTVWDFELSEKPNLAALFDLRMGNIRGFADTNASLREWYRFMAEYRLSPSLFVPPPGITFEDGEVILDTEEFDQMAKFLFDELKVRQVYMVEFYAFGWGHYPRDLFGFSFPSPEFREAYQEALGAFREHLKKNGWEDNFVLVIADEPFAWPAFIGDPEVSERVIEQMRFFCELIREVDPEIKIYASTIHFIPGFDGYLNHWGICPSGRFPVDEMERRVEKGETLWFTTDGHFIIDTPFSAIERLLPHFCWAYGVSGYEFWGISWWTHNPFEFGWHRFQLYAHVAGEEPRLIRYPSGDGFLAYPGWLIGKEGPLSSIRLAQVREGMEDYEYMWELNRRMEAARLRGECTLKAEAVFGRINDLVSIPNAGGRHSTKLLPNPDVILEIRKELARGILKQLHQVTTKINCSCLIYLCPEGCQAPTTLKFLCLNLEK